ncbi:thioredoxin-like protein [Stackebrandtia albiflava]|uniref:Thioredoxin-like protein n=1 Tax=Stackebrandtia albiflava TaxID=406432 RepID=A0A562V4J8_9ACTN|nr:thioredoxin domain-containing protein [Stackebrandtia albiflava]TWJ12765.1 thioredoxin-like protein [Stackebrandtia albiflava]
MAKRYDKKQQAARVMREQREREQRRRQLIMGSAIVGVVVVILGLIGVGLYLNQSEEVVPPQAQHTESGAIVVGDGPVTVDLYEDFMCPICGLFDEEVGGELKQMAEEGRITLNVHPIAILDGASQGTRYSTRSAAAAVCAADDGKFVEYADTLFTNQPEEQTPGLDDEELIALGEEIGLGSSFESCVKDKTYRGWVQDATDTASADGVTGTPTVFVDGEQIEVPAGQGLDAVIEKLRTTLSAKLAEAGVDESSSPSESASEGTTQD